MTFADPDLGPFSSKVGITLLVDFAIAVIIHLFCSGIRTLVPVYIKGLASHA